MKNKVKRKVPEIILREGKPFAVMVDYREMLERSEDVKVLGILEQTRKKPLKFRKLDDFIKEYQ